MGADASGGVAPLYERSIGIDLSANAVNTAAVELMWHGNRATIVKVWGKGREPLEDECLLKLLDRSDAKIGIDCPFGWPKAFIDLMADQAHHGGTLVAAETPLQREPLALRCTDRDVIKNARVRPLSVSADRIAHVAFRLAGLRSRLQMNHASPRDGSGAIVEVYPAAALSLWSAPFRGYKGKDAAAVRVNILAALERGESGLKVINLAAHHDELVVSDHLLDALICALIARDCDMRGTRIPQSARDEALLEGWIHLPSPVELGSSAR